MSEDGSKLGTIEERNGKFRVRLPRALDPDRRSRTFETRELAERFLRGASAVLQEASPHGHDTLALFGDEMLDARELAGIRSIRRERSAWRRHVMTSPHNAVPNNGAGLQPVGASVGTDVARMLAVAVLTEIADVGVIGVPLATAFDVAVRRIDSSYPAEPSMLDRLRAAARFTR